MSCVYFRASERGNEVENFPDGYPRFAALMNSDINTRLYRRFGLVRNRLLLRKQDCIAQLSEKLRSMDKTDEHEHPEKLWSRRHGEDAKDDSPRSRILVQLDTELKDYDALLLREHAIASISKPTVRNHRTIFDWVYNNKPVVQEEYQYLYEEGDFALLGNQQDDWLRSVQERIWSLSHHQIFRVSNNTETTERDDLMNHLIVHLIIQIMHLRNIGSQFRIFIKWCHKRSSQIVRFLGDDNSVDAANHYALCS